MIDFEIRFQRGPPPGGNTTITLGTERDEKDQEQEKLAKATEDKDATVANKENAKENDKENVKVVIDTSNVKAAAAAFEKKIADDIRPAGSRK